MIFGKQIVFGFILTRWERLLVMKFGSFHRTMFLICAGVKQCFSDMVPLTKSMKREARNSEPLEVNYHKNQSNTSIFSGGSPITALYFVSTIGRWISLGFSIKIFTHSSSVKFLPLK